MLTQLGHAVHWRDGSQTQALGVCRRSAKVLLGPVSWDRAFAWFDGKAKDKRLPLMVKSNRISNVHRRVPLDLFIVPVFEDGRIVALSVHVGPLDQRRACRATEQGSRACARSSPR